MNQLPFLSLNSTERNQHSGYADADPTKSSSNPNHKKPAMDSLSSCAKVEPYSQEALLQYAKSIPPSTFKEFIELNPRHQNEKKDANIWRNPCTPTKKAPMDPFPTCYSSKLPMECLNEFPEAEIAQNRYDISTSFAADSFSFLNSVKYAPTDGILQTPCPPFCLDLSSTSGKKDSEIRNFDDANEPRHLTFAYSPRTYEERLCATQIELLHLIEEQGEKGMRLEKVFAAYSKKYNRLLDLKGLCIMDIKILIDTLRPYVTYHDATQSVRIASTGGMCYDGTTLPQLFKNALKMTASQETTPKSGLLDITDRSAQLKWMVLHLLKTELGPKTSDKTLLPTPTKIPLLCIFEKWKQYYSCDLQRLLQDAEISSLQNLLKEMVQLNVSNEPIGMCVSFSGTKEPISNANSDTSKSALLQLSKNGVSVRKPTSTSIFRNDRKLNSDQNKLQDNSLQNAFFAEKDDTLKTENASFSAPWHDDARISSAERLPPASTLNWTNDTAFQKWRPRNYEQANAATRFSKNKSEKSGIGALSDTISNKKEAMVYKDEMYTENASQNGTGPGYAKEQGLNNKSLAQSFVAEVIPLATLQQKMFALIAAACDEQAKRWQRGEDLIELDADMRLTESSSSTECIQKYLNVSEQKLAGPKATKNELEVNIFCSKEAANAGVEEDCSGMPEFRKGLSKGSEDVEAECKTDENALDANEERFLLRRLRKQEKKQKKKWKIARLREVLEGEKNPPESSDRKACLLSLKSDSSSSQSACVRHSLQQEKLCLSGGIQQDELSGNTPLHYPFVGHKSKPSVSCINGLEETEVKGQLNERIPKLLSPTVPNSSEKDTAALEMMQSVWLEPEQQAQPPINFLYGSAASSSSHQSPGTLLFASPATTTATSPLATDSTMTKDARERDILRREYRNKSLGILVSSIKSEWPKLFGSTQDLTLSMSYFGIKKITKLLLDVPNLVVCGSGGCMRVATIDHAKAFYSPFPPENLGVDCDNPHFVITPCSLSPCFQSSTHLGRLRQNPALSSFLKRDHIKQLQEAQLLAAKENINETSDTTNDSMDCHASSLSGKDLDKLSATNGSSESFDEANDLTRFQDKNGGTCASFHSESTVGSSAKNCKVPQNEHFLPQLCKLIFALIAKLHQEQHAQFLFENLSKAAAFQCPDLILDPKVKASACSEIVNGGSCNDQVTHEAKVDKDISRLAEFGVRGVAVDSIKMEWERMYKTKMDVLLHYTGLSEVTQLLEHVKGIRVVGVGAAAKCFLMLPDALKNYFLDNAQTNEQLPAQAVELQEAAPHFVNPANEQYPRITTFSTNETFNPEAIKETLQVLQQTLLTQASALEILADALPQPKTKASLT